jgi:hypothetical protein
MLVGFVLGGSELARLVVLHVTAGESVGNYFHVNEAVGAFPAFVSLPRDS